MFPGYIDSEKKGIIHLVPLPSPSAHTSGDKECHTAIKKDHQPVLIQEMYRIIPLMYRGIAAL